MKWSRSLAAAFLKRHKAIIIGQGIYTSLSWLFDNPLWWLVELKFEAKGVLAMMVGAVLINFSVLLYYSHKKISWIGWDQGVDIVKEKEQWLRKNFVRVCIGAIIIVVCILHIPNEIPWEIIPASVAVIVIVGMMVAFLKVRMAEDIFALFFLSIVEDSFITTAYLRHGREDGLKVKDYIVFLTSSIISTVYWAGRNGIVTEAIVRPLTK